MKSCRECVHGGEIVSDLVDMVRCEFPLPIYIAGLGSKLVYLHEASACPTYQPREERETQP